MPKATAVRCRFLNGVTGRAGLAALCDTFVSDPHLQFREGQSVRAQVVSVDAKKQRFSLTLKQSLCGGQDAAFLASLFRWARCIHTVFSLFKESVFFRHFAICSSSSASNVHGQLALGYLTCHTSLSKYGWRRHPCVHCTQGLSASINHTCAGLDGWRISGACVTARHSSCLGRDERN